MSVAIGVRKRLDEAAVADLVRSAAAGSDLAWEELIDEFGGLVWAVARSYRLRDADAADVAQATWTKLVGHLDRLSEPCRVGAWLATTARRECLRELRIGWRETLLGDDAPPEYATEDALDADLLCAERDEALWRSFSCLRDTDRALLRLLIADPRPSYDEIAAALDIPIGSIGPTRARALERLRNELERQGAID